jgi:hypothetical protein
MERDTNPGGTAGQGEQNAAFILWSEAQAALMRLLRRNNNGRAGVLVT